MEKIRKTKRPNADDFSGITYADALDEYANHLESQMEERDKLIDDIYNYIQYSDDDYFIAIRNRINNLKLK